MNSEQVLNSGQVLSETGEPEWRRALLALGSNLGSRAETLAAAVAELSAPQQVRLREVSPIVETLPVGGPEGQSLYLNMVIEVDTTFTPWELLEHCQAVEAKHHRERNIQWAARTLDVDIICYQGVEQNHPQLTLPHPRAAERAFVLVPWGLMDPEATLSGERVVDLARQAEDREGVEWPSSPEE